MGVRLADSSVLAFALAAAKDVDEFAKSVGHSCRLQNLKKNEDAMTCGAAHFERL